MLGAIVGDYIGSRYEFRPIKTTEFELLSPNCIYTDDTLMTIALARAMANKSVDYAGAMRTIGNEYVSSYGHGFWDWLNNPHKGPYGSWANGSSMRVSPSAWFSRDFAECLALAEATAKVTHNHPEGIRGARATAAAIYASRSGWPAEAVRAMIQSVFGYDLSRSVAEVRKTAVFELKSWISVPEAMICAFEANSYEEAVRNAVSLGGDADTQAAIAGSIAEGWFDIPDELVNAALGRLPEDLKDILNNIKVAARYIPMKRLTHQDVLLARKWDPEENAVWDHQQAVTRMNNHEIQSLEKWERFEAGIDNLPSPPKRRNFLRRWQDRFARA